MDSDLTLTKNTGSTKPRSKFHVFKSFVQNFTMDMFHRNGQTDPDINAIPPTPMTSQITITTSTSSTIAPPSKPTPNLTTSPATATTEYLITTKSGTSLEAFEALIRSLPDAGQGAKIIYPHVSFQGYVTMLSDAEATQVADNPIVAGAMVNAKNHIDE